jgi:uncharacterized protein YjbJ (UPF0337 family)
MHGTWDQVEGNWRKFKGEVQRQWGKLTSDELDQINGNREKLLGKIQERYGIAKNQAEHDLDRWFADLRD